MIAIETKYLGATNTLGSRIKAVDGNGNSATVSYGSERSTIEEHAKAAKALLAKMGRYRMDGPIEMIAGGTRDGYVFTFANADRFTF